MPWFVVLPLALAGAMLVSAAILSILDKDDDDDDVWRDDPTGWSTPGCHCEIPHQCGRN
jgi:hypothetical protein